MWSRVMLVSPPAASVTPSARRCASPWLEVSIAACVTPSAASPASSAWSSIGSGVVWVSGAATAPSTPVVPKFTARRPSAAQIWRVKLATDVLPLVPVTAVTVAGCAPEKRAAASASRRRGSSTTR
jgi:hypothetical protein